MKELPERMETVRVLADADMDSPFVAHFAVFGDTLTRVNSFS